MSTTRPGTLAGQARKKEDKPRDDFGEFVEETDPATGKKRLVPGFNPTPVPPHRPAWEPAKERKPVFGERPSDYPGGPWPWDGPAV